MDKIAEALLIEALQEITECKGRFSRDQLTHAHNVIFDMGMVAHEALLAVGVTPRANPQRIWE